MIPLHEHVESGHLLETMEKIEDLMNLIENECQGDIILRNDIIDFVIDIFLFRKVDL